MSKALLPTVAFALAFIPLLTTSQLADAANAPHPQVSRVRISKSAHALDLLHGDEVIARYAVAIGPGGAGPKRREGDAVTPVGRYHIVQRTPSRYGIFMRLDYPNAQDRERFARLKASGAFPKDATIGGDIGIHGAPPAATAWRAAHKSVDWTLGCVAVDDAEIAQIAAHVRDGTIVDIED